jgi:hypothetical protein
MSREVSVEEQIHFIEVELTDDPGSDNYEAILATLRRSVLLERVAEAARKYLDGPLLSTGRVDSPDEEEHDRKVLKSALAALRDHDKLGKEG